MRLPRLLSVMRRPAHEPRFVELRISGDCKKSPVNWVLVPKLEPTPRPGMVGPGLLEPSALDDVHQAVADQSKARSVSSRNSAPRSTRTMSSIVRPP